MSLSAEAQNAFLTAAIAAGAARGIEPAPNTSWIEIIGDTRCDTCCAVLALAGVEQYTSNTAYRVPVRRRDQDGLLVVAAPAIDPPRLVPAPDAPPAAFRVIRDSAGEPAAVVEYPADPQERAYRVEVRIDQVWLSTLIIHARDEILASDQALKFEMVRWPSSDLDVWSVSLDEDVTEEFPAVVMGATSGSESGPGAGADPGGAVSLQGPGSSARSSPAFAAADWGPLAPIPDFSQRCEKPDDSAFFAAVLAPYSSSYLAHSISTSSKCMASLLLKELVRRADDVSPKAPEPPPEAQFTRFLRVPIGPEEFAAVTVVGFADRALPSPLEPSDFIPFQLSNAALGDVISSLHRAQSFAPFEQPVSP